MNWPVVLGATDVELVLAPIVLEELDKLKNDPASNRRSKRARMLNSKLRELLMSSPTRPALVRSGVTLSTIINQTQIDWRENRLDENHMDDRLIASMLEFRDQHLDHAIMVVSNDFGLQLKAMAFGFQVIDPEGQIQAHEFPSEEEQTVRRLSREVESLRQRLPDLRFGFVAEEALANHITFPRPRPANLWRMDEDIRKELDEEKDACLSVLTPAHWKWVEDECNQYIAAVEHYIEELEDYLLRDRILNAGFHLEFDLMLENSGSAPASDVRASIQLPDQYLTCRLADKANRIWGSCGSDRPSRPKPPEVPRFDQLSSALAASLTMGKIPDVMMPHIPYLPPYSLATPVDPGPETWAAGTTIRLFHPKLRAKELYFADSILVMMPPFTANGLQLNYRVHADELPEPMWGKLNIQFSDR